MEHYYISNTFTLFFKDDLDFNDVMFMIRHYDKDGDDDQKKYILRHVYSPKFSQAVAKYRHNSNEEFLIWLEMLNIIKKWDNAWIKMVDDHPECRSFCPNEVAQTYVKLIS